MNKSLKIVFGIILSLFIAGGLIALYLYFVAGGSVTTTIRDLFPQGESIDPEETIVVTPEAEEEDGTPLPKEALFQISRNPVAGASFKMGTSTALFVERETGNLHSFSFETQEKVRLTNATLPRLQEALFSSNGNRVALRYLTDDLSTIETFLAVVPLVASLDAGELDGSFLPRNISTITAEPSGQEFFYIAPKNTGVGGYITTTGTPREVWSSPLREWVPMWVSKTTLSLSTAPSGNAAGFGYMLNKDTDRTERVLGNVTGLTLNVAPNLKHALYSESAQGWLTLSVLNLKVGSATELPVRALPEKCVWLNNSETKIICAIPDLVSPGVYPDLWYQGIVSFSDSLWSVDIETLEVARLVNLPEAVENPIDAIDLKLSADDELLMFTNKRDGGLWGLRLDLLEENF